MFIDKVCSITPIGGSDYLHCAETFVYDPDATDSLD